LPLLEGKKNKKKKNSLKKEDQVTLPGRGNKTVSFTQLYFMEEKRKHKNIPQMTLSIHCVVHQY